MLILDYAYTLMRMALLDDVVRGIKTLVILGAKHMKYASVGIQYKQSSLRLLII